MRNMFALDDESLSAGIARVVDEQIGLAIAEVRGRTASGRDEQVHEARKRCKRLRAVVRLLRGRLGDDVYRRENVALRDVGRALAPARDAQILIETLDAVVGEGRIDGSALADARRDLEEDLARCRRDIERDSAPVQHAVDALEAVARRSRDWPLHELTFDDLRPGLRRVYRTGHARMRMAVASPTAEHFHDWRKRVKDLWHHTELLTPAWPTVLGTLAEEVHTLSGLLGDDHDRAVLAGRLCVDGLIDDPAVLRDVLAASDGQCAQLRVAAQALGERVYAERAGRYVDRLDAYWHAGALAEE